jgi:hypothetical protein
LYRLATMLAGLALLLHGAGARAPVNPLLPWHGAVLDGGGKLLAWYHPEQNLGYDHVLRVGWRFVERGVPRDPHAGVPVHLAYAVFDPKTRHGVYWQHNPAFLYASFVDSVTAWYPYSGDRRAIAAVREMLDYQLRNGTTPLSWSWAGVPFATACGGDRRYGRCLSGRPATYYGGLEPDKVGLLGLGYARFYELTGERRFLGAAERAADALAKHVRAGGVRRTPWPFRVDGRTGGTIGGAEYGGMVVAPVALLDELVRLGAGRTQAYRRARAVAWTWVLRHQLDPRSVDYDRWGNFYEDGRYNPANRNQMTPSMTARYLLTAAGVPADAAPRARVLLELVKARFGRGPFGGAWGIDEQRTPGRPGCCSRAGLGSDTSRWAAVTALLYARTGDPDAREDAFRSLNYATYFARSDGRVSCCGVRQANEYWFSDGYGDYLRNFNWAMAAMPELAPKRRAHLLGSTSVVRSVAYGTHRVAYRTFARAAEETLRLPYRPRAVVAGGRALPELDDGDADDGYVVRPLGGGDYAVAVHHSRAAAVKILGP